MGVRYNLAVERQLKPHQRVTGLTGVGIGPGVIVSVTNLIEMGKNPILYDFLHGRYVFDGDRDPHWGSIGLTEAALSQALLHFESLLEDPQWLQETRSRPQGEIEIDTTRQIRDDLRAALDLPELKTFTFSWG